MIDPVFGDRDADRGDLLASLDAALGPLVEQVLRRFVSGPSVRELRREIIEYIGDVVTDGPAPIPVART